MIAAIGPARLAAFTVALLAAAVSPRTAAAGEVNAIETGSSGNLTMCPMLNLRCNLYHHIDLPQIAVGDTVQVSFGSNPKQYAFPVARIVMRDGGCTMFSQPTGTERVEKIELPSCRVLKEAR